ncbi:GNAT family N-acetyltransferase [Kitasatospora sp. NPDC004531]
MEITAPRDEDDLAQYTALSDTVFAAALRPSVLAAPAQVRVAVEAGRVVGGLIVLPMSQYYGGTPLPAAGLSTVCVAADRRGRGVAGALITETLREQAAAGAVVSPLWTPALGFYRRWGWDVAGDAWTLDRPIEAFAPTAAPYRVADVTGGSPGTDLYERIAVRWNGPVERDGAWWRRRYPSDSPGTLHRIDAPDGTPRALVGWRRTRLPDGWGHRLDITDYWADDPQAAALADAFIGAQRSQARSVRFLPGTLPALPEHLWRTAQFNSEGRLHHPWMARLLDPARALAATHWPAAARGRLALSLTRPDGAAQALRITVEDGRATAEPGHLDEGPALPVGLFTSWFTGAIGTDDLRHRTGADHHALDLLAAMGGQRRPWLPDLF